jgi:hypothetical protein
MDIERWDADKANNTAAVPDGAPEGWLGADVNNWGRETMAAVRRGWEADEYRDISMAIGGSRYTITRDSDTQITVGGVDLSTANGILFAGQTIKIVNSVSAEKHGRVVTATFSSPDTVIVVDWTEGEVADGTSALTTGTLAFTAGSPGSVTRTTGSWSTDGLVAGDRLRVVSTLNTGYYTVSNVAALTMDLVPVQSGYAVVTEAAGAFSAYRIDTVGLCPAAPLTSLWIAGSQTDQIRTEDVYGTDPLEIPTNELLGDAAYKRENELSVANSVALGGATPGPGNGLDADTVDGIHGTQILQTKVWELTSDVTIDENGLTEEAVTGWEGLTLPGTPDGSVRYMIDFIGHMEVSAGASTTTSTFRFRNGSAGTIADSTFVGNAAQTVSNSNRDHYCLLYRFIWTPATGDIYLTVSHEFSASVPVGPKVKGATQAPASSNSQFDFPSFTASMIVVSTLAN